MPAGRIAETGFKTVICLELAETVLFDAIPALHHFPDGCRQIVVDKNGENPAKKSKCMNVRIKKSLLPFTMIKPYKVLAGILGTHTEKRKRHLLACNDHRRTTPVHLRFTTLLRITRNECLKSTDAILYASHHNITANGGLAPLIIMFRHQSVVNPTSRMSLLLRLIGVALQPFINNL